MSRLAIITTVGLAVLAVCLAAAPRSQAKDVPAQSSGAFLAGSKPWFPLILSNGPPDPLTWPVLRTASIDTLRYDPGKLRPPRGIAPVTWDAGVIAAAHQSTWTQAQPAFAPG